MDAELLPMRAWAEVGLGTAQSFAATRQGSALHDPVLEVLANRDIDAAITYSREHFANGLEVNTPVNKLLENRGVDGVEP